MRFYVTNYDIHVGYIRVRAVAQSSLILVGDAFSITMQSILDTPPDSLYVGPFIPLSLS